MLYLYHISLFMLFWEMITVRFENHMNHSRKSSHAEICVKARKFCNVSGTDSVPVFGVPLTAS